MSTKAAELAGFIKAVKGFVVALSESMGDINDFEDEREDDGKEKVGFPYIPEKNIKAVSTALIMAEEKDVIAGFIDKKSLWNKVTDTDRDINFFLDNCKDIFSAITVDLAPIITPIRIYVDLKKGKYKLDKDDWPMTEVDIETLWTWVDKMVAHAKKYETAK